MCTVLSNEHKDRISMSSTTRILNHVLWARSYSFVVRALVAIPSWVWHFTKGREESPSPCVSMQKQGKSPRGNKKKSFWERGETRKETAEGVNAQPCSWIWSG